MKTLAVLAAAVTISLTCAGTASAAGRDLLHFAKHLVVEATVPDCT